MEVGAAAAVKENRASEGGDDVAKPHSDVIRVLGTAVPNYSDGWADMSSEEEDNGAVMEDLEGKKKSTKLNMFKKKIVTLADEKKGGRIGQLFRKSPDPALTSSSESLQIKEEEVLMAEGSKLRKFKTGLKERFKDIAGDMQDMRDEGLHSLNELKVEYQEKAEQKKAIITSFTEEEVKILRKGSPLTSQVTKQMSSIYLSKRHSILRLSLLSASNLSLTKATPGQPEPMLFTKLSLGPERFKTRQVPYSTCPTWRETTSLARQSEEDDILKIEVLARGSKETVPVGEAEILLNNYQQDTCTQLAVNLKPGVDGEVQEGSINLVFWVTGGGSEEPGGPGEVQKPEQGGPVQVQQHHPQGAKGQFGLCRTFEDLDSVGSLTVTVVEATGLATSKLQGSVNPFCVLELDNQFHRTRTVTKSKSPVWDKTLQFEVEDAFSVLKIGVISEKINSPQLILGRACLRLSSLHQTSGQQRDLWIPLKDRKLRKAAKGENPRVHLSVTYTHNKLRAAVSVFKNPEEKLYEVENPKFERLTLLRNVSRIKMFLPKGSTLQRLTQSYTDIIAWKEPARTVKFFIFYMFFIYYFQIWWIPVATLYKLFVNFRNKRSIQHLPIVLKNKDDTPEEEDEEEEEEKEEKKSLKQSLDTMQNTLQEFQEGCGLVASYLEKASNMAHFEEGFLSSLFCLVLMLASLVLGLLGLRTVLLLWGVNKFTKKLREADPIPTNEIDNLLRRVPDCELLEDCRDVSSPQQSSQPSSP